MGTEKEIEVLFAEELNKIAELSPIERLPPSISVESDSLPDVERWRV